MGRHAAVLMVTVVLVAGCGDGGDTAPEPISGPVDEFGCPVIDAPAPPLLAVGEVLEYPDAGNDHVACDEGFDQSPPTSGNHFDAWQNCGFYTEPVRDYGAVHALEHGAVWISFRPDLSADEIGAIEAAVAGGDHLLAAPYPGLENPIVLTAWTRQLAVDRWSDPLVEQFLEDYTGRLSTTAPEAGASCDGGFGVAPDQPDANYAAILEQVR